MTIDWIKLSLFVVFTSALLWFTLRRPYAHRGYRFIAFECLLALIFLQSKFWFNNPTQPTQLISWLALGGSLALALHGFRLLHTSGAPDGDIENTTVLVTRGAYRYIRHPLYASLLLLGIGAVLKNLTPISLVILLGLLLALNKTARVEERANIERFGDPYRAYMQQTRMFIPYIW